MSEAGPTPAFTAVPEPPVRPLLPSAREIIIMTFPKSIKALREQGVDCDEKGLQTLLQCQKHLFSMLEKPQLEASSASPALEGTATVFQTFQENLSRLEDLAAEIKLFLEEEEELLRVWGVSAEAWNSEKQLLADNISMLLVAGDSSCGKSTFINALLGEPLLPTGHNSTTAPLCEIKYGSKKKAVIYEESRSKDDVVLLVSHELDLDRDEDRQTFLERVSPDRLEKSAKRCAKVEIAYPSDLLKNFALIDSPGVNEDDDFSAASRQITERCQRDTACGFIYVIDATQPAEVAGQVGGLLAAAARGTKTIFSPDSAIFVVNKWDKYLENSDGRNSEETQKFLDRLYYQLSLRWPGFKSQQVVTMNSELALLAHEFGVLTEDMKVLCRTMNEFFPRCLNNILLKELRNPLKILDSVEQSCESAIRNLKLPVDEWKVHQDECSTRLQEFKRSFESGKFAQKIEEFEKWFERHTEKLVKYLQSEESKARATKCESAKHARFQKQDIECLVNSRLMREIRNYIRNHNREINTELPEVEEEFRRLSGFHSKIVTQELSEACESTNTAGFQKAALGALLFTLLPISLPIYGLVKLLKYKKSVDFHQTFKEFYDTAVRELCSGNRDRIMNVVKKTVMTFSASARFVFEDYPIILKKTEEELKRRHAFQEKENLPQLKNLLKKTQKLIGKASAFLLELGIEDFTAGDVVLQGESSLHPEMGFNFGDSYCVQLGQQLKEKVSLTVGKTKITCENAETVVRARNVNRKVTGKCEYLLKFYGLVKLEANPLKFAFAFEWCKSSLAETLAMDDLKAIRNEDFEEAKRILFEIFSGIAFLHEQNLIHLCLAPEVIKLTTMEKQVKIANIGLGKDFQNSSEERYYRAPEVEGSKPYGQLADIFSIGLIMWELWHGRKSYDENGMRPESRSDDGSCGRFVLAQWEGSSHNRDPKAAQWQDFMELCWSTDPSRRPTAENGKEKFKSADK